MRKILLIEFPHYGLIFLELCSNIKINRLEPIRLSNVCLSKRDTSGKNKLLFIAANKTRKMNPSRQKKMSKGREETFQILINITNGCLHEKLMHVYVHEFIRMIEKVFFLLFLQREDVQGFCI